ncbi:MAG: DUF1559 domain-containing protein, partial [Planctomycetia bacterium]|nr:DUF1559 domain-containing protein [Planctomycetia bacterium]
PQGMPQVPASQLGLGVGFAPGGLVPAQQAQKKESKAGPLLLVGGLIGGSVLVLGIIAAVYFLFLKDSGTTNSNSGTNIAGGGNRPANTGVTSGGTTGGTTASGGKSMRDELFAAVGESFGTPGTWATYTGSGFAADFPGAPKENSQKQFGQQIRMAALLQKSAMNFAVMAVDVPNTPSAARMVAMDAMVKEFEKHANVSQQRDVSAGSNPGREVSLEAKSGPKQRGLARLFVTDGKLFMLVAAADEGKFVQADADKFLDSFKITGGGQGTWEQYTSSEHGYSVSFPGKATSKTEERDGVKVHEVQFRSPDGVAYTVQVVDVKQGDTTAVGSIRQEFDGYLSTMSGQQKSRTEVTQGSARGEEIVFDGSVNGEARSVHIRAYATQQKIYKLFCIGPQSGFSADDAQRFVTSFRLAGSANVALHAAAVQWLQTVNDKTVGVRQLDENHPEVNYWGWMVELLPHLGHQELYDQIDFDKAWHEGGNVAVAMNPIPEFLNPADKNKVWTGIRGAGLPLTHFVGVSGVRDKLNDNPATWPRSDPRAGIFGYKQVARPSEITDGLAQTILLIGNGKLQHPWCQGGGSTIRAAGEPFFNETTGFGSAGLAEPGAYAAMADGSVRVISAKIDPKLFRALVTIHGKETVDLKDAGKPLEKFPSAP